MQWALSFVLEGRGQDPLGALPWGPWQDFQGYQLNDQVTGQTEGAAVERAPGWERGSLALL